ncbi:MAG: hypothetical protein ACM3NI_08490 [Bacteroidota bacterium]
MTTTRYPRRHSLRPILLSAFLATVAALQGCATTQNVVPMSPDDRAALKQASVIHVVHCASPAMNLMTPASVAGGGLITSATGSTELPSGAELERGYSLPNPAGELSGKLVQRLKAEGRMTNLRVEPRLPQLPAQLDASSYRGKYPDGLVLEVTVPYHGAAYKVVNWKTYTYGMFAKARLIRAADAKVLWSDVCVTDDKNDAYRLDVSQFEANNGAHLKQLFHHASDQCSQVLADKFLGKAQ